MSRWKSIQPWPLILLTVAGCSRSNVPQRQNSKTAKHTAPAIQGESSSTKITIQELDDKETYSGAGTGFQLASATPESTKVIFGYADDNEPSNMRINNQLVSLKHVSTKVLKKGKGRQSLGERVLDTWGDGSITVDFDYTITSAGEGGVGYKGTVTVKLNGQTASFPIIGGSGC